MISVTPFTKLPPKDYNQALKAQLSVTTRRTASSAASRQYDADFRTIKSFRTIATTSSWPSAEREGNGYEDQPVDGELAIASLDANDDNLSDELDCLENLDNAKSASISFRNFQVQCIIAMKNDPYELPSRCMFN